MAKLLDYSYIDSIIGIRVFELYNIEEMTKLNKDTFLSDIYHGNYRNLQSIDMVINTELLNVKNELIGLLGKDHPLLLIHYINYDIENICSTFYAKNENNDFIHSSLGYFSKEELFNIVNYKNSDDSSYLGFLLSERLGTIHISQGDVLLTIPGILYQLLADSVVIESEEVIKDYLKIRIDFINIMNFIAKSAGVISNYAFLGHGTYTSSEFAEYELKPLSEFIPTYSYGKVNVIINEYLMDNDLISLQRKLNDTLIDTIKAWPDSSLKNTIIYLLLKEKEVKMIKERYYVLND